MRNLTSRKSPLTAPDDTSFSSASLRVEQQATDVLAARAGGQELLNAVAKGGAESVLDQFAATMRQLRYPK